MDLLDRLRELADRAEEQLEHIKTEEATKTSLVMPFLSTLGYDVFNPLEILPEFIADVGDKKGEKVDYAIKKDQQIIMLIECKCHDTSLGKEHITQLFRYFSTTESRFGILTNGVIYQFFSDIDKMNIMDEKPFFVFDLFNFQPHHVQELNKFAKSTFCLDNILNTASNLKYTSAVKHILEMELESPSESFVKFFVSQIYQGKATKNVIEQFTPLVKNSAKQLINEKINDLLKSAMNQPSHDQDLAVEEEKDDDVDNNGIITTQDEIDGFNIVRAILSSTIDINRIYLRDTKGYCGILLDDNNRKPICRLYFNRSQKYLALLKMKDDKREETKVPIDTASDIFNYGDKLKETIAEYQN